MARRTPKVSLLCVGSEDPSEGGVKDDSSEGTRLYEAACVHHAVPVALQWFIGMCAALRGKTRADGEPASVTDEKPARDSAGRYGPVD
jgi:hypothetical protein